MLRWLATRMVQADVFTISSRNEKAPIAHATRASFMY